MNKISPDLSKSAIIKSVEANLNQMIKLRNLWPRAEVHDDPELLSCLTDIPFPLFNVALRAQLSLERVDGAIQAVVDRAAVRQPRCCYWQRVSQGSTMRRPSRKPGGLASARL